MQHYARLVGDRVVEVFPGFNDQDPQQAITPAEVFPPDLAAQFVGCPPDTVSGATFDGTTWANPPAPPSPPITYKVITPPQMKLLYTSPERIFIRANLAGSTPDAVMADFFELLNDPQLTEVDLNLASVQGAIQYSINLCASHMTPPYDAAAIAERIAAMMTGKPQ
jgi:hypothetical protein